MKNETSTKKKAGNGIKRNVSGMLLPTEKAIIKAANKFHNDSEYDGWLREDIVKSFEAGAAFMQKKLVGNNLR